MISKVLKKTILETLQLDDWEITGDTLAYEVPGWDSLNHAAVLCAVEKTYGIRFQASEVVNLQNVGELEALVDSKTGGSEV